MLSSWVALLNNEQYNQVNAGSTLSNSVTLTDISAGSNVSGEAFLMQGSYMYPGMQLRFRANGIASTSGAPGLTLGIYYGGVAGTALAVSTFNASANMSNTCWELEAICRVDAVGTSATLRTIGHISGLLAIPVMLPQTSSSGGSASVASGTSSVITLGAQWSAAAAGNSITCYQFLVEQLN